MVNGKVPTDGKTKKGELPRGDPPFLQRAKEQALNPQAQRGRVGSLL